MSLYYRASAFGNSSHRHGDQGNVGLFDQGVGILVPTGSFGYRFGSKHHYDWTRQTLAHNLPLVDGQGQKLDDQSAVGRVLQSKTESNYHIVTLDLSESYADPLKRFHRTIVLLEDNGLIVVDSIALSQPKTLNWRLHSPLNTKLDPDLNAVLLSDAGKVIDRYQCNLLSHSDVQATLTHGYSDELKIPGRAIESDASVDVTHIDWQLTEAREHQVVACCIKQGRALPEVRYSGEQSGSTEIQLALGPDIVSLSVA